MRRTLFLLFFTHLLTRLVYINFSGVFNNYNLQSDSLWLVGLADETLKGNFNFDIGRFIASPLFPCLCGLFKFIFTNHWQFFLILFQIVLSAISGLYIYKITLLIFKNKETALISSLLFAFFPMTLWYVNTFSQESLFQSFLIIAIYYLLLSVRTMKMIHTVVAAILFSLTYLTKSHILIFSLFIPLLYLQSSAAKWRAIGHCLVFSFVSILFSLPYGLYHEKVNGTYVISSNGAGYQFFLGNTEAGYVTIVNVPQQGTDDYNKMKDITVQAGYFNGSQERYASIMNKPQKIKQNLFYGEAIKWIFSNPEKFFKLKLYDTLFFLLPGVSYRHYTFLEWASTVALSLPIYLFGYITIYKRCKENFKEHSWILYLILTMFIFSTIWYVQNRFRTITLEPFYLIYASKYVCRTLGKVTIGIAFIHFLDIMFLEYLQSIMVKRIFGKVYIRGIDRSRLMIKWINHQMNHRETRR
jgi:hypothetical protein